jgi:hypothetical protein
MGEPWAIEATVPMTLVEGRLPRQRSLTGRSGSHRRHPRPPRRLLVVDRRVSRIALRLAHGDPRRIEVLSETAVLVHNR